MATDNPTIAPRRRRPGGGVKPGNVPWNKGVSKWPSRRVRYDDYAYPWLMRTRYGISKEQYAEMHQAQDGRCAICGRLPAKTRLSIDHDHVTMKVRGLLCTLCNSRLGWLDKLRAQIEGYLERSGGN